MLIPDFDGGPAICLSCGMTDKQVMMRRHRRNCAWVAHWRALNELRRILGME